MNKEQSLEKNYDLVERVKKDFYFVYNQAKLMNKKQILKLIENTTLDVRGDYHYSPETIATILIVLHKYNVEYGYVKCSVDCCISIYKDKMIDALDRLIIYLTRDIISHLYYL